MYTCMWKRENTLNQVTYQQTCNISRTKSQNLSVFLSSWNCFCAIHWSHVLSREWRKINNFSAYQGALRTGVTMAIVRQLCISNTEFGTSNIQSCEIKSLCTWEWKEQESFNITIGIFFKVFLQMIKWCIHIHGHYVPGTTKPKKTPGAPLINMD